MLKKKLFTSAMALGLAAAMLAGCGGSGTQPSNEKGSSEPAAAAAQTSEESKEESPKAPAEPVELKILTYNGVKDNDGTYMLEKQIAAYTAENPNVTITFDMQSENNSVDFLKKLDLMQLSGETADIILIASYRDMADRAAQDFFAPLDECMTDEGIVYEDVYSYPSEINGQHYAIPYNAGIYHVLINKTMMEEAGLTVPPADWTWDDYREYAQKMTKGEGAEKIYGSYMHTWTEYRREGLFNSKMDNPYVKEDGSSNLDDPDLKDWLQFIYDMENEDKCQVPYSDAIATNMAYRDVFFQGKAAMVLTGSWIYDDINNTEKFPHDFETVFATFPRWKDGPAERTQGSASYYAVGKNCKNVPEAYKFLRWMSTRGAEVVNDFPTELGADFTSTITAKIAGHEDLYDVDSLMNIWGSKNMEANAVYSEPELFKVVDDIFNVETGKFMIGGQDLETTLKNIQDQAAPEFEK